VKEEQLHELNACNSICGSRRSTSDSGGSRGETQSQHGLGLGSFIAEMPYLPVIRMSDGALRYRASGIEEFLRERENASNLRRKRR
jgi:hypothetical protein